MLVNPAPSVHTVFSFLALRKSENLILSFGPLVHLDIA